MSGNTIVCDFCGESFNPKEISFKTIEATVKEKSFEVVYYKCTKCEKSYVVCMLDYWGKKLQTKYVKAMDSYRKAYNNGENVIKLEQKQATLERLKKEAMDYQNKVLKAYGELIPEELLV